jgi:DNA primase
VTPVHYRYDAIDVRAAATAQAVLDHYGWRCKRAGARLKSAACPGRADHSRPDAFSMSAIDGRWRCFPCGTGGDVLDFIAAIERLDVVADFQAVLEIAAAIGGVGPSSLSDDERRARREIAAAQRAAAEHAEQARRAALARRAIPRATGYWSRCAADHPRGVQYLAERGLPDAARLVRFDLRMGGSPAIPLYTSSGEIRNVVRRCLPELGDPKTPGLPECPTPGTLLGSLVDVCSTRPIVVVEGVADALTAAIAWPRAVVLGAHGADNLPAVARAAARAAEISRTRLLLVPHNDETGHSRAAEAGRIAIEAGLSVGAGTLVVVKHGAKDLNDAWRNGWRPAA